jgi:3-phosphoshikimate 1-carboxyvinyltransferase
VAISSLAEGKSRILSPLESDDAMAAVGAYRLLGAEIELTPDEWRVRGIGGKLRTPDDVINTLNSGTTMNVVLGSCALLREGVAALTGDAQVRRRPSGPLAQSLNDLGASVTSTRNNGCPPFVVRGRLRGGTTSIEARSSQYVTSLLINTPFADGDSRIIVPLLMEQPYVEMTMDWLRRQGIKFENDDLREFRVPGGQRYKPVNRTIPADFSSATFFLAASALGENDVTSLGLDMNDTQGDKAVVDYLRQMGAKVEVREGAIRVQAGELRGVDLDLNATPDALPMMAVVGCFAKGTTRLLNVPQARIKETDRITVMCAELKKMGAKISELKDGLVVEQSKLKGAKVNGHGDHRIVMALAVAGLCSPGQTLIDTAEAVGVTFPTFLECMRDLGAKIVAQQ